ncbi:hypothetical protein B0H66DRAFT_499182 [Apodospora peruviana]|uniref:Ubiquitin carboxyl-terminal hydrolase n=1 Tax=Apodospora peruviana TaxID=516989 RepID=A0AAE0I060_9PEZI|nr:hypothetical protein B0H66DRAFT_499182 [Apodospora peruviana]
MAGSATLLDHSGSSAPTNGQKPIAFSTDGHGRTEGWRGGAGGGGAGAGAGAGAAGGGKRSIPHIDDIVSVEVDIDPHASIEKVLQQAETCLRQAESAKTFGRPDFALKDYIRANIILLDSIKRNQGWVALQSDNKGQYDRYQRLLRQVRTGHGDFEKIKAEIKADNAKTRVRPSVHRPASTGPGVETHVNQVNLSANVLSVNRRVENSTTTIEVTQNGPPRRSAPPPPKVKPMVHPKPPNLHGNALNPADTAVSLNKPAQDLAQRFANLRLNTGNRVQDPRIKTQPPIVPLQTIPPPPPPKEPPKPPPASMPVADSIVDLPRVPAAIYNPARGTISKEAAELPSSAPRAMFTRTNSIPNNNKSTRTAVVEESFVPAQSFGNGASNPAKRSKLNIPMDNTISAGELLTYMKMGRKDVTMLLIDIRNREEFDAGHIMFPETICVESDVLRREHISASQIADSMVLAPLREKLLFEGRHDFDLVIFYDLESKRIPSNPSTEEEKAIVGLYNALTQYDFSGEWKETAKPRLLAGGLEAWTGLVGSASLQSTTSAGSSAKKPMARTFLQRRQTYVTRPIQDPAEAKKWEDAIAEAGAISPVRTTEDFFRRFPPVSSIQESMTSPVSPSSGRPSSSFSFHDQDESIYTALPSPPKRPPPTVPRRSYSGLAEPESNTAVSAKRLRSGVDNIRETRTGLVNPGVLCFANSSLQAMFATPGFSRDLWTGNWLRNYLVPRKPDETLDNLQLLTKHLAKLFYLLNQGNYLALDPRTFMGYIHRIHSNNVDGRRKPESEVFGGPAQQDAQEFYSFIMDNIHDETNIYRDKKPPTEEKPYTPKDGTIIQNAMDYWRYYSSASASIVDRYFRGLEVFISRCHNERCRQEIRLFQPTDVWILNLSGVPVGDNATDIYRLLANHQADERFDELLCETCKKPGRTRRSKFARLPDRLTFCLNRFSGNQGGRSSSKIHTKVRFPIRDLDLTMFCAEPDPDMSSTDDGHFAGRMRYDCYAVTVHQGQSINGGHYYSYVQDEQSRDPTDWFKCNDQQVESVKIGSSSVSGDYTEHMYQNGNTSAYMVYYRRQGT